MAVHELFFLVVTCSAFAVFGIVLGTATLVYRRSLNTLPRTKHLAQRPRTPS